MLAQYVGQMSISQKLLCVYWVQSFQTISDMYFDWISKTLAFILDNVEKQGILKMNFTQSEIGSSVHKNENEQKRLGYIYNFALSPAESSQADIFPTVDTVTNSQLNRYAINYNICRIMGFIGGPRGLTYDDDKDTNDDLDDKNENIGYKQNDTMCEACKKTDILYIIYDKQGKITKTNKVVEIENDSNVIHYKCRASGIANMMAVSFYFCGMIRTMFDDNGDHMCDKVIYNHYGTFDSSNEYTYNYIEHYRGKYIQEVQIANTCEDVMPFKFTVECGGTVQEMKSNVTNRITFESLYDAEKTPFNIKLLGNNTDPSRFKICMKIVVIRV